MSKTKNAENRFDVIVGCEHISPIKCQAKFVVDGSLIYFFLFLETISLDISCESSAWLTIHMKYQDLFSLTDKKNSQNCCLLQL